MNMRKAFASCLLILAFVLGLAVWKRFSDNTPWLNDIWGSSGVDTLRQSREWFKEHVSPETLIAFGIDSDDALLEYANRHPERPWLLWWWFKKAQVEYMPRKDGARNTPRPGYSGQPLSKEPMEIREWADRLREQARILNERDPDNGLPLLYLAGIEAYEGGSLVHNRETGKAEGEVLDAVHVGQAMDLLHQAAQKPFVSHRIRELLQEWMNADVFQNIDTVEKLLPYYFQFGSSPISNLQLFRMTVERLCVQAGEMLRTAETPEDASRAYVLYHDMQTIGAKIASDGVLLINWSIGLALVESATEKGDAALRAAGHHDMADRLLERGRALYRPCAVMNLIRHGQYASPNHLELLENDPQSIREAEKAAANTPKYEDFSAGLLFSITLVPVYMHALDSPITPGEMQVAANFEYWYLEHLFSNCAFLVAWLLSLVLFVLHGVFFWGRRSRKESSGELPSRGRVFWGSVLFAAMAALPGLTAATVGHGLGGSNARQTVWLAFWNIWGLFAAVLALALWVRAQQVFPPNIGVSGESTEYAFLPKRWLKGWEERIVVGMLFAAIPMACIAYAGIGGDIKHYQFIGAVLTFRDFGVTWYLVGILMLPTVYLGIFAVLYRASALIPGRSGCAGRPYASRLLLAGLAGGLVLWYVALQAAEWRERTWARRDTLLIPRTDTGTTSYSRVEDRIMESLAKKTRETLEKYP